MKIIIEFESTNQNDEVFERAITAVVAKFKRTKISIINKIPTGAITFDSIEKSVCNHVLCLPEELQLRTRKREVVEARQICHYLSRTNKLGSLAAIGYRFGKKDHATVLHSMRTVTNLLSGDFEFQYKYKAFIQSFNNGN